MDLRSSSLRDRKKIGTRQALFEAATRLSFRQGFRETTVDAIAEAAGVSRRTFFRYFPSKEAAFFGNHEERLAEFRALLDERAGSGDRLTGVRLACEEASRYYVENRSFALKQFEVVSESARLQAHDLRIDERWERAIAETLSRSGVAPALEPVDAEVAAGAILGMLRATLHAWLRGGGKDDLVRMRSRGFDQLESGLRA